MRARVGFVSGSVVRSLRPSLDAIDIVVTGKYGALEPWWHTYTDDDRARALELMELTGVAALARPSVRRDLGGRAPAGAARPAADGGARAAAARRAVRGTGPRRPGTAARPARRAGGRSRRRRRSILVTHHVEEIPPGTTHALVLAGGRVVASGPIEAALTTGVAQRRVRLPDRARPRRRPLVVPRPPHPLTQSGVSRGRRLRLRGRCPSGRGSPRSGTPRRHPSGTASGSFGWTRWARPPQSTQTMTVAGPVTKRRRSRRRRTAASTTGRGRAPA